MISPRNIHALDHFKRNTAEFRERLKRTGEPEVLTVDGRAELVVQSAEGYEKLLDQLDEFESVTAILQSMADIKAGRVRSAEEVHAELRRKFGIPEKDEQDDAAQRQKRA